MISQLAKSMGTTESDLMCLAQSVANSLVSDGAVETFLNVDEGTRIEMAEAYVLHAVKKFESFHSTFLTNPEARKTFMLAVFNLR